MHRITTSLILACAVLAFAIGVAAQESEPEPEPVVTQSAPYPVGYIECSVYRSFSVSGDEAAVLLSTGSTELLTGTLLLQIDGNSCVIPGQVRVLYLPVTQTP